VKTHVNKAFSGLERRTERLIGFLRLLALLLWHSCSGAWATLIPLVGLGVITVAGLFLAGSDLFRPWVFWLFATFDVLLLTHCLVMLAIVTGQPLSLA